MTRQREMSAIRQADANARLVDAALRRDPGGLRDLLAGLGAETESRLLVDRGKWVSTGNLGPERLPDGFLDLVHDGTPARQRIVFDGRPSLAVSLPLPARPATYVEVAPHERARPQRSGS